MKRRIWAGILLSLCPLPAALSAQTIIPHPHRQPRYIVLDTRQLSTMKQELSMTAMQGYRVIFVTPRPGAGIIPAGMTLVLEKLPEGSPTPEYWIADDKHGYSMGQLGIGAQAGYRYVKRSAFEHRGHDFWGDLFASAIWGEKHVDHHKYDTITGYALMEKIPGREVSCLYAIELQDSRHAYRATVDQLRSGFRLVGELEKRLILEKCYEPSGNAISMERDAVLPQNGPDDRVRLLSTDNWAKRQRLLEGAVAQGFRISHAFGKWVGLEKSKSLLMTQYTALGAKSEADLEKRLNAVTGSRVIPDTLTRKSSFWNGSEYQIVMEKAADKTLQYEYKVLGEKADTYLQDAINMAAAKGYEVQGLSRDAFGITVLLEKPVTPSAPPAADTLSEPAAAGQPL